MPATHQVGDEVTLKALPRCPDWPQGLPQETGTLLSIDARSGTCVVLVPPEDDEDDGLREAALAQLVPAS